MIVKKKLKALGKVKIRSYKEFEQLLNHYSIPYHKITVSAHPGFYGGGKVFLYGSDKVVISKYSRLVRSRKKFSYYVYDLFILSLYDFENFVRNFYLVSLYN
jgi:hypothetical protein